MQVASFLQHTRSASIPINALRLLTEMIKVPMAIASLQCYKSIQATLFVRLNYGGLNVSWSSASLFSRVTT